MQLTFLAGLAAMAVGASAQTSVSPDVASSVLLVLATALPADERSYALASSSAFAAQMASSLAAGKTPGWLASLPADVKSILPQLYPAAAEASTTPVSVATPTPTAIASSVSAIPTGANNTAISSIHSATLSAAHSTILSATGSATKSALPESTGAASTTRVAFGAGIAGVVGFLGMLAL